MQSGIERDKIEVVMGTLRRIVGKIQSGGEDFELGPKMQKRLEDMDLTASRRSISSSGSRTVYQGIRERMRVRCDR